MHGQLQELRRLANQKLSKENVQLDKVDNDGKYRMNLSERAEAHHCCHFAIFCVLAGFVASHWQRKFLCMYQQQGVIARDRQ
jgi:hypothetical protein